MFFEKEFIWYTNHFAYHITEKDNIPSIIKNGLIPSCGERSESVGDIEQAIYFFDYLYSANDWADRLYEMQDTELEILKFNLKRRKWYVKDPYIGDFYVVNKILPEKIEILDRKDEEGNIYSLNEIEYQKKLIWVPLKK